MRLMIDVSLGQIPRYEYSHEFQLIEGPWSSAITDRKLIEVASYRYCDGVIFLDEAVLVSNELRKVAIKEKLSILSTRTYDPVLARRWLIEYLPEIKKQIDSGPFFGSISKGGLRNIETHESVCHQLNT